MSETTLPTTIIIFGASGDLTRRKLIPALYNNFIKGRLHNGLRIIGTSRSELSHEAFRDKMRQGVQEFAPEFFNSDTWDAFAPRLCYVSADTGKPEGMNELNEAVRALEGGTTNRLYYLSVAPELYIPMVRNMGEQGMADESDGWRRIIVEKPFGKDLDSARTLTTEIHKVFQESQVYRIDHYLGKETAQNILFFRFANTIFEPVWNRNYIDSVQLTVAEAVDVGHRAGYYDTSGVVRDMIQNHLLQLLTLVAMEPPTSFEADVLRNEKVKVLNAVRPIEMVNTVRAQYSDYRRAEGVAANSQTPTYAAFKLYIDNWRWQNVPFYLRSGKALKAKASEIIIQFRCPPHLMFDRKSGFVPNILSICIQPDEGIHLSFEAKVPDSIQETRPVDLEFHYDTSFKTQVIPDSYERLLMDALNGDASLFNRSDEIEAAWKIIDPVLKVWETSSNGHPLVTYSRGTWGPVEANDLLMNDGFEWQLGCIHES